LSPSADKGLPYLKYPIYLGGNRGRGQVYPDGSKSNNTVYDASKAGKIASITPGEKGDYSIVIDSSDGSVTEAIPAGPQLIVSVGDTVTKGQPLTNNPNVGGFGQADGEIVLQDPNRVLFLIVFIGTITLAQIFLVLKKKQFEKVQLAEMNF